MDAKSDVTIGANERTESSVVKRPVLAGLDSNKFKLAGAEPGRNPNSDWSLANSSAVSGYFNTGRSGRYRFPYADGLQADTRKGLKSVLRIGARVLSNVLLAVLGLAVLLVLSVAGWLYGVWQNRRLSGMP